MACAQVDMGCNPRKARAQAYGPEVSRYWNSDHQSVGGVLAGWFLALKICRM